MAKKKINFDNTIKKVEGISNKVDIIMRNRLIIAFFLIVDGITFLLNPDTTLEGMARNIILLVLLAAFSVLIANLASKTKDRKTIIISIIILIAGIIAYIYPDFVAAYMQLLLALFIIYDGLVNISNALNLDWMTKFTGAVSEKYNKVANRNKAKTSKKKEEEKEKFKEIDNNINDGLEEQKKKLINPLKNIVNKTSKSSKLFIAANVISIILGIVLLIFPDVSMMVWGLIFLYTGLPNLFAAMKSMDLFKKLKEKRFKEILFDAEKAEKQKKDKKNTSK
ncbi:DUF308 domain-containing protein [Candidatus Saccharibacteria bacterium]|nr:DUF308 domain-containing protein [Candidatus Saccharibacteria bacterium]